MQTPIPQPYDITDIPHIAWVPGVELWVVVTLGLIVLGVTMTRRGNRHTSRGSLTLLTTLLHDLRACVSDENNLHVERASRISRRIVSHIADRDIAELTSDELRAIPTEELSPRLRPIIDALASFEDIAYAPPSQDRDSSAKKVGSDLVSQITLYRDELRGK